MTPSYDIRAPANLAAVELQTMKQRLDGYVNLIFIGCVFLWYECWLMKASALSFYAAFRILPNMRCPVNNWTAFYFLRRLNLIMCERKGKIPRAIRRSNGSVDQVVADSFGTWRGTLRPPKKKQRKWILGVVLAKFSWAQFISHIWGVSQENWNFRSADIQIESISLHPPENLCQKCRQESYLLT